jgi:hypothetical protein
MAASTETRSSARRRISAAAKSRVDERRRRRERRRHEQPDGDRNHEARVLLREEHLLGAECVQAQEAARRHEGERQEQHACVAAPVRRLAGGIAEDEGEAADEPEDDEVRPVVLDMRIELRAQKQRDEPHQR